jgi:hypothetical protein
MVHWHAVHYLPCSNSKPRHCPHIIKKDKIVLDPVKELTDQGAVMYGQIKTRLTTLLTNGPHSCFGHIYDQRHTANHNTKIQRPFGLHIWSPQLPRPSSFSPSHCFAVLSSLTSSMLQDNCHMSGLRGNRWPRWLTRPSTRGRGRRRQLHGRSSSLQDPARGVLVTSLESCWVMDKTC